MSTYLPELDSRAIRSNINFFNFTVERHVVSTHLPPHLRTSRTYIKYCPIKPEYFNISTIALNINMKLLDLPTELVEAIILEMMHVLSFTRANRLRSVNGPPYLDRIDWPR